jgi:hypothetical protein
MARRLAHCLGSKAERSSLHLLLAVLEVLAAHLHQADFSVDQHLTHSLGKIYASNNTSSA